MKKILRTLTVVIVMMALIITTLPTVNAEAKADNLYWVWEEHLPDVISLKATSPSGSLALTAETSGSRVNLYCGETYELSVKKAKGKVKWESSDNSAVSVKSTGKTTAIVEMKDETATITATTKNGRKYTATFYGDTPTVFKTTYYIGGSATLDFDGPEVESYSVKKNKYFTLTSDGRIKPKKVTKEPIEVTVNCKNGQVYSYGISIAEKDDIIKNVKEPGENQWGILYVHDKEYDYIPEMTFYNVNDVETYAECLQEGMRHGTDTLHFLGSPDFSSFTTDVQYSGEERVRWGNYSSGMVNSSMFSYEVMPEHVIHAYRTAVQIIYWLTIRNYPCFEESDTVIQDGYGLSHYDIVYKGATEVVKKAITEEGTVRGVVNNIGRQLQKLQTVETNVEESVQFQHYGYEACGLFMTGEACCSGYADAMALCLTILGLDNGIVTSYDCGHGYNAVKIDGEWLYYDLTSNPELNTGVPYEYFEDYIDRVAPNPLIPLVNGPYIYYEH